MKKITLICLGILFLSAGTIYSQIQQYRKIGENGAANMVFAEIAISKGSEAKIALKETFSSSDAIYARCYFPKAFGQYNPRTDEQFVIDIYLNNKLVERKLMKHPDNDWDQIQLYIANTGDDDFKMVATALQSASEGENTLKVFVGLERFTGTKDVLQADGTTKKEKVFTMTYISEGIITVSN